MVMGRMKEEEEGNDGCDGRWEQVGACGVTRGGGQNGGRARRPSGGRGEGAIRWGVERVSGFVYVCVLRIQCQQAGHQVEEGRRTSERERQRRENKAQERACEDLLGWTRENGGGWVLGTETTGRLALWVVPSFTTCTKGYFGPLSLDQQPTPYTTANAVLACHA